MIKPEAQQERGKLTIQSLILVLQKTFRPSGETAWPNAKREIKGSGDPDLDKELTILFEEPRIE